MSRPVDVRDCSRDFLEAMADYLRGQIAGGVDRRELLAKVEAQIPNAPAYSIEHRRD